MPRSKLNKAQRKEAQALLADRPLCYNGTCVIVHEAERTKWFNKVSAKMKELKLGGKQVGEFCDLAGVPD